MTRPTLHDRLDKLEKHFDKELDKMRDYVDLKIQPLHDFFIGQKAIKEVQDQEIKSQIKSGGIVISKEAWWLIVKIVGFIGTALAIIVGIINGQS